VYDGYVLVLRSARSRSPIFTNPRAVGLLQGAAAPAAVHA